MQTDSESARDNVDKGEFASLLDVLLKSWLLVLAVGLASGLAAYLFATQMTRAYRAEVVVAPVTNAGGSDLLAAFGGRLGGLGALAGLGVGGDTDRNERIAVLSSRDLARRFLEEHAIVSEFCASRTIKCRPGRGAGTLPSESESNLALKKFLRRVLTVTEDKRTGLVRVSITWRDRQVAARWANEYVALANRQLTTRSVDESNRRIAFLRDAADRAQYVQLREATFHLMESEIESIMVATTRSDFAFRVVDSAAPPDERDVVRPRKALLAVAGAVLGTLVALGVVWWRARRRFATRPASAQG